MLFEPAHAHLHAVGVHHAAGELEEGLRKNALRAVAVDNALIKSDIVENAQGARGYAGRLGLLPYAIEPLAEPTMAAFGRGRQRDNGGQKNRHQERT